MTALRTTLIVLLLGSAAALGWSCQTSADAARLPHAWKVCKGPVIDPTGAPSHSCPPARRQKTRPDPTPEDNTQPSTADLPDKGPDSIALNVPDPGLPFGFFSATGPTWSEPVVHALLYQLTRRFRC